MSFSIAGKTAIVTGAANGIGLAIARHFVEQGANVMCADMDEDKLAAEIGDVGKDDGSSIRYFAGDLRKKLTIANLLSATIDAFDGVDILVNASRQVVPCDPTIAKEDMVEYLLEQNLMTSLRMTQQVSKWMRAHSKRDENPNGPVGSIVNLSSIAAVYDGVFDFQRGCRSNDTVYGCGHGAPWHPCERGGVWVGDECQFARYVGDQ